MSLLKKCFNHAVCARAGPPLAMFLLCGFAYWLYSLHTTREQDPQDKVLAIFLAASLSVVALYLLVRTREWRPQMLGMIGFLIGQAVFYWIITAGRLGWARVSTERTFDVLRAFVTVGLLVVFVGIGLFEYAEWRKRRRLRRGPQIISPEYIGPERRNGGIYDRRRRRRRW